MSLCSDGPGQIWTQESEIAILIGRGSGEKSLSWILGVETALLYLLYELGQVSKLLLFQCFRLSTRDDQGVPKRNSEEMTDVERLWKVQRKMAISCSSKNAAGYFEFVYF